MEASVSATNDSEAYVRASALNVITESAASDLLWQKINSETDVTRRCYMLLKDSEALVRRAAAKALPMIAQGGNLRYILSKILSFVWGERNVYDLLSNL